MTDPSTLPTADDALAELPPLAAMGVGVMVEAVDEQRARLCLAVPAGAVLAEALYGRPGWQRQPEPFLPRRPTARRDTFWRWVRAEPADTAD